MADGPTWQELAQLNLEEVERLRDELKGARLELEAARADVADARVKNAALHAELATLRGPIPQAIPGKRAARMRRGLGPVVAEEYAEYASPNSTRERALHGLKVGAAKSVSTQLLQRVEDRFGANYPEILKTDKARPLVLLALHIALKYGVDTYGDMLPQKQRAMVSGYLDLGIEGCTAEAASSILDSVIPMVSELAKMVADVAPLMGLLPEEADAFPAEMRAMQEVVVDGAD